MLPNRTVPQSYKPGFVHLTHVVERPEIHPGTTEQHLAPASLIYAQMTSAPGEKTVPARTELRSGAEQNVAVGLREQRRKDHIESPCNGTLLRLHQHRVSQFPMTIQTRFLPGLARSFDRGRQIMGDHGLVRPQVRGQIDELR